MQVIALRAGDRLVPLRPGHGTLRVWPVTKDVALASEPLAEVTVDTDPDRWVPAARIAEACDPIWPDRPNPTVGIVSLIRGYRTRRGYL